MWKIIEKIRKRLDTWKRNLRLGNQSTKAIVTDQRKGPELSVRGNGRGVASFRPPTPFACETKVPGKQISRKVVFSFLMSFYSYYQTPQSLVLKKNLHTEHSAGLEVWCSGFRSYFYHYTAVHTQANPLTFLISSFLSEK